MGAGLHYLEVEDVSEERSPLDVGFVDVRQFDFVTECQTPEFRPPGSVESDKGEIEKRVARVRSTVTDRDHATDGLEGRARYAIAAQVRLRVERGEWQVDPDEFETTLYRRAAPPGEPGWLFFREHCWRGQLNHPEHVLELAEEAIGVSVVTVSFRGLETDQAYLDALEHGIEANLELFNAESVSETLTKYLGSSIQVEHK